MSTYENPWIYQGEVFDEEEAKNWYGCVYKITCPSSGRFYIGRKYFTKAGRKTIKGKVKKIRLESDWRDYYGSSDELKADVERLGKDKFTREILKLCKGRGEVNYWELKYILDTDALIRRSGYNAWCSGKIHAGHIKGLWIDDLETGTPPLLLEAGDNNKSKISG